jgi:hypothetical protein
MLHGSVHHILRPYCLFRMGLWIIGPGRRSWAAPLLLLLPLYYDGDWRHSSNLPQWAPIRSLKSLLKSASCPSLHFVHVPRPSFHCSLNFFPKKGLLFDFAYIYEVYQRLFHALSAGCPKKSTRQHASYLLLKTKWPPCVCVCAIYCTTYSCKIPKHLHLLVIRAALEPCRSFHNAFLQPIHP